VDNARESGVLGSRGCAENVAPWVIIKTLWGGAQKQTKAGKLHRRKQDMRRESDEHFFYDFIVQKIAKF